MSVLNEANRVYAAGYEGSDPEAELPCRWFAKCDRPANGVADAGPSGQLPICKRCAEVVGCTEFVVGGE